MAGLLFGWLLASAFITQARAEGAIFFSSQLVLDGDYKALKKPGWLALVRSGKGLKLTPVRFKFYAPKDQTGDDFPQVMSPFGDIFALDSLKEKSGLVGFFLVGGLKPGSVEEIYTSRDSFDFSKEPRRQFRFKSHSYTVYKKKGLVFARIDGMPFSTAASKSLGKISGSTPEDYSSFSIDWAGDMNNDGIIDFVITAGNEKAAETCLLLSKKIDRRIKLENAGCQFFSG